MTYVSATTALIGHLVPPAPRTTATWRIELVEPHMGRTTALMTDDTTGIADLRRRIGGHLKIGGKVHIEDFEVRENYIRALRVA